MRIDEHDSDLGRWRTAQRKAHPSLRQFVKGYVTSASSLPAPVRERLLPSTEVPLILNFGAAHRQRDAIDGKWFERDGAWIVGLQESHRLSEAAGERDFLIVRFTPLGAHLFLRLPMHLITDRAVDLSTLDPTLATVILSRVGVARSFGDRFDAIDALIADRVREAVLPRDVSHAWRKLEAAHGCISLTQLASELECSHRTLISHFRTAIGQTPKAAARLLRFNRAMQSLEAVVRDTGDNSAGKPFVELQLSRERRGLTVGWAGIAADCGYTDQSHFIKEFRHFAGATPTEFVSRVSNIG